MLRSGSTRGVLGGRFSFPGLLSGWYAVAVSEEVARGQILCRRYFDQELVVYRGDDGSVRIAEAFCPHLKAHLGRVGRLEGNLLRCGFHGFQYDGLGRCVATPYGGPPPSRARLRLWEAREQNGLILTWYGAAGEAHDWEVPVLDDAGWNRIRWRRLWEAGPRRPGCGAAARPGGGPGASRRAERRSWRRRSPRRAEPVRGRWTRILRLRPAVRSPR